MTRYRHRGGCYRHQGGCYRHRGGCYRRRGGCYRRRGGCDRHWGGLKTVSANGPDRRLLTARNATFGNVAGGAASVHFEACAPRAAPV
eukprot:1130693-Pyramimonas_sp.AAC.1